VLAFFGEKKLVKQSQVETSRSVRGRRPALELSLREADQLNDADFNKLFSAKTAVLLIETSC
jgi:hypothetical protein